MTLVKIRSQYVAPPGKVLLACDLSQAESWVVAHLANEMNMKHSLLNSDIHTDTGAFFFHKGFGCSALGGTHIWSKDGKKSSCKLCALIVGEIERYIGKQNNHANCVDGQTEVLTKSGWVRIDKLKKGKEVAQWNKNTEEIEFVIPTDYHEADYVGKMLRFKGKEYDQLVTPNHRMPYHTNNKLKVITAAKLASRKGSPSLPITGNYSGDYIPRDAMLQLIVAIQADATHLGGKTVFHLKKARKITRLKELLSKLEISYRETLAADDATYIRFQTLVEEEIYLSDKHWELPQLLRLSGTSLDVILAELPFWDGTVKGVQQYYFSASLSNIEVIQTISYLRSRQAIFYPIERAYRMSFNRRKFSGDWQVSEEEYQGKIYCLSVPSSFFMVRRNGKISVTGNSYGMGAEREAQVINKQSDKPPYVTVTIKQCKGYQIDWHMLYAGVKMWHGSLQEKLHVDRTLITPYGFKRKFYAQFGDPLYKEAYAFIPQSTVADHFVGTTQLDFERKGGLLEIDKEFCQKSNEFTLINMSHDSFAMEVPEQLIDEVAEGCIKLLTRPMIINDEEFTIPVDAEVGHSLGDLKTWKKAA